MNRSGTLVVALAVAAAISTACGGGAKTASVTADAGGKVSSGAGALNLAHFCRDYKEATYRYSLTYGIADASDPAYGAFLTALTQAKAEAPSAVKHDVATMLDMAKAALSGKTVDLTTPSARVSAWADTNCPGDSTGTSGLGDSNALGGASSSTTPDAPSGGAASSAASAAFCSDAATATYAVAGLAAQTDAATADWEAADASVRKLVGEAPSTVLQGPWSTRGGSVDSVAVQQLVSTLESDVNDIANNGQGNDDASQSVAQDNTNVQTAVQRVC